MTEKLGPEIGALLSQIPSDLPLWELETNEVYDAAFELWDLLIAVHPDRDLLLD
ncbi:MAG: hypothetical protein H0V77_01925 [Actinobacteria bacterium]|nr:hypothetical protein [Actinomycetota bacterium]